jgi:predicted DNA-binding transcriptional regulator AlpA
MPKPYDPHSDLEALLMTHDASAMLGVTIFTLRKWRITGKGPKTINISGNRVAYRRRDLIDWITSREAA